MVLTLLNRNTAMGRLSNGCSEWRRLPEFLVRVSESRGYTLDRADGNRELIRDENRFCVRHQPGGFAYNFFFLEVVQKCTYALSYDRADGAKTRSGKNCQDRNFSNGSPKNVDIPHTQTRWQRDDLQYFTRGIAHAHNTRARRARARIKNTHSRIQVHTHTPECTCIHITHAYTRRAHEYVLTHTPDLTGVP